MGNLKDTLYKFRDCDDKFHRLLLSENQFYIPTVKELNDPFDYQINLQGDLIQSEEDINTLIELMCKSGSEFIDNQLGFKQKVEEKKSLLRNNPTLFFQEYNKVISDTKLEKYGVYCLTENWDNILMWSHYSKSHTGFCVGFNTEKIISLNYFTKCSKVDYKKHYPKINPIKWNENDLNTDYIESSVKFIKWEYEQEVRFIRVFSPYEPTSKSERLLHIDDSLINDVTLGINITPENEEFIKEICFRKKIRLYKTRKSDLDFKLERFCLE